MICASVARDRVIRGCSDGSNDNGAGAMRELHGADADGSGGALHQHGAASYRTCDVNTAVRRDSRDAKACALLETHFIRERCRVCHRDDRILGGRTERTIGLRTVAPHTAAEALSATPSPTRSMMSRAVAVWNDTRIRHSVAKSILALLDVAGIDSRGDNPDAHFARSGHRIGHVADGQYISWPNPASHTKLRACLVRLPRIVLPTQVPS